MTQRPTRPVAPATATRVTTWLVGKGSRRSRALAVSEEVDDDDGVGVVGAIVGRTALVAAANEVACGTAIAMQNKRRKIGKPPAVVTMMMIDTTSTAAAAAAAALCPMGNECATKM